MRILIATGIYPPDIGGPAIYSKLILEELNKLGHRVNVLTYGLKEIKSQGSKVKSINKKHNKLLRYFLYFWNILKLGRNADIIYVQDSVSSGFPTALANIFLKKKLVLKIVGDYAWEQEQQLKSQKSKVKSILLDNFYPFKEKEHTFKIKLFRNIQTWVAKKADKIITPSFYLKRILIKGWGIDDGKIEVIYNSFDVPNAIIASEASSELEGVARQSHNLKVLSVGRLVLWKGFDTLIDIVSGIQDIQLEIIGDGPEKDNLELGIRNNESANIKLLGKLSHNEVVQKMYSADLLILNTAYEGLSHVILEAMAVGLPVVVSRAGGNTELIGENEERGYLFPYNDKEKIMHLLIYVHQNKESVQEKAVKAQEFVKSFSQEKMIERLEDVLKKI